MMPACGSSRMPLFDKARINKKKPHEKLKRGHEGLRFSAAFGVSYSRPRGLLEYNVHSRGYRAAQGLEHRE